MLYETTWINLENMPKGHRKTYTTWYHLNEDFKIVKLMEMENRMVVARGWSVGEKVSCCPTDKNFNYGK